MLAALCAITMKLAAKILMSIILFPYSFGAIWLVNLSTSQGRTIHWYLLFFMVFVALTSLWSFTWFKHLRKLSVAGLILALTICIPATYIGFPDILYLVGPAAPLIILSALCVWLYWRQSKAHNKALKSDAERAGAV